jgi:hypothetical protein
MTDRKQGLAERRVELEHRKKTGRRFSRALSSHLDCKATLVRLGHGSVAYVNSDSGTPAPATRERFCNFEQLEVDFVMTMLARGDHIFVLQKLTKTNQDVTSYVLHRRVNY